MLKLLLALQIYTKAQSTRHPNTNRQHVCYVQIFTFNRPCLAGAVIQTALSFIDSLSRESGKDNDGSDKEVDNKKQKFELDFDQSDDEDIAQDEVKREVEAHRQEPATSQEEDVLAWWRKKKHR